MGCIASSGQLPFPRRQPVQGDNVARAYFRTLLDLDADGFATIDDLQRAFEAPEFRDFVAAEMPQAILDAMDLDKDGQLSEEEFIAGMAARQRNAEHLNQILLEHQGFKEGTRIQLCRAVLGWDNRTGRPEQLMYGERGWLDELTEDRVVMRLEGRSRSVWVDTYLIIRDSLLQKEDRVELLSAAVKHWRGCSSSSPCFSLQATIPPSHHHDAAWVKPVTAASDAYGGRTPLQEKQHLEAIEEDALRALRAERGPDYPHEVDEGEGTRLVEALRRGDVTLSSTFFSSFSSSFATGGLAPTERADFAVVSGSGSSPGDFCGALLGCALHGVGVAIVWEAQWKDLWFWVWKRNADRLHKAGKSLLVLTKADGDGQIGFAQSVEVLYLQERGYPFTAVDIDHFNCCLTTEVLAATCQDWEMFDELMLRRSDVGLPLVNCGQPLTFELVNLDAPDEAIRAAFKADGGVELASWGCTPAAGLTPLLAAVDWAVSLETIALLLDLGADPSREASEGSLKGKSALSHAKDLRLRDRGAPGIGYFTHSSARKYWDRVLAMLDSGKPMCRDLRDLPDLPNLS